MCYDLRRCCFFLMIRRPPRSTRTDTLFPYTTLFKAEGERVLAEGRKWVTTSIDLPWDATHGLREIDREVTQMSEDELARVATLEAEAEELEGDRADASEGSAEIHARPDAVEHEIGTTRSGEHKSEHQSRMR